ncbi:MAG: hypothetical protein KDE19_05400 [Caldilineaceae bacterium]|nr:hypothetical protein [Caldilineaceae bacterium]
MGQSNNTTFPAYARKNSGYRDDGCFPLTRQLFLQAQSRYNETILLA